MNTPQLENGFIRIANEIYEAILLHDLTGYQLKVLMAIVRKTYGYRKKQDVIALSQLTDLTGIAKPHVSRAIHQLKDMNIVTTGGNGEIGINKDYKTWKPLPRVVMPVTDSVTTVTTGGNEPLPRVAPQKIIKDNITKDITTNVVTGFGNPDINDASKYFLEKMQIPKEDCTQKESRRYWFHLLKESRRGLEGVKWLIDQAASDDWYKNNITSSKDLYYKRIKLIARRRGDTPVIAVMKGGSDEQTMETGSGNRSILLN